MATFKNLAKAVAGIVVVGAIILSQSIFVVDEGTRAIKLRFNKVVRDSDGQVVVYTPGINFKPPFIDTVVNLDARLQTLDDTTDRFVTVEKKDVLIDSYVKWRIVDFGKFYQTTSGNYERANNLLRRKISDRLRSEVGSQTISDIVSGTRAELMSQALTALNDERDGAGTFGIRVVDVRVNKIELPQEVSDSIYRRMRAERQAVAGEHRAKGQEKAQEIRAQTDRDVAVILAQANLQAARTRTQADAQAAKLLNDTYAQNYDLFYFLKNLESYASTLRNGNSVLLVKPNQENSYLRYLFDDSLTNVNKSKTTTVAPKTTTVSTPTQQPAVNQAQPEPQPTQQLSNDVTAPEKNTK